MSAGGAQPPGRVPTLTEVVNLPPASSSGLPPGHAAEAMPLEADVIGSPLARSEAMVASNSPPLNEELIVQRVLADVQRQVDLVLEYRLREILLPILSRAADGVVRDARAELASTLREVVARAVAQELSRHRGR
jgi:hypothetical protein